MEWWEEDWAQQEYNTITYQYENTIKTLKKYDLYNFKESDTIALTCMRNGEYLQENPNETYSYTYQKTSFPARYTFGQLRPLLPLLTDQFYSDVNKLRDRIHGVFKTGGLEVGARIVMYNLAFTATLCRYAPFAVPGISWEVRQEIVGLVSQIEYLENRSNYLFATYHKQGRREILQGYKAIQITESEFINGQVTEVNRDLYRTIEEPSTITSTEMTNRIANKLLQLPNYTAYVKTLSGEYVLQGVPPDLPMPETEFRRRIHSIQKNNLQHGYVRRRKDIEQEFMEREPLVPDLSYQPNQPRHPSHANTMVVPPLPQSRKKKRNITV
jgi:hypothetical protein